MERNDWTLFVVCNVMYYITVKLQYVVLIGILCFQNFDTCTHEDNQNGESESICPRTLLIYIYQQKVCPGNFCVIG